MPWCANLFGLLTVHCFLLDKSLVLTQLIENFEQHRFILICSEAEKSQLEEDPIDLNIDCLYTVNVEDTGNILEPYSYKELYEITIQDKKLLRLRSVLGFSRL